MSAGGRRALGFAYGVGGPPAALRGAGGRVRLCAVRGLSIRWGKGAWL